MNCRRSEELWTDYHEGTLAPPLQQELRDHLDACESCESLFRTFREVVDGLRSIEAPAPADELASRVLARTLPELSADRRETPRVVPFPSVGLGQAAAWLAATAAIVFALLWRPPDALSNWGREVSQSVHQAYSFGVRTYERGERLIEELNVLRMTVGVAFEDRLDRLNERLKDLEEASRKTEDEEQEESRLERSPSSGVALLKRLHQETRSLL